MIIIFKMSRAPKKISNIKCNYCPDTGGPNKNCLLLLMILYILETSILLVGATLIRCESYQLPMRVVKVLILLVHIVYKILLMHIVHKSKILLVHIVHNRGGLMVWHQLSHVGVVRRSCKRIVIIHNGSHGWDEC